MVKRVDSSPPEAAYQSQSYFRPSVVVLVFTDFFYLLVQVTKSLIGRVGMGSPEKLYQDGCEDFQNKLYDEAIRKFTLALECKPDESLRLLILVDRAAVCEEIQQHDKAIEDLTSALGCSPDQDMKASILADRAFAYLAGEKYQKALEDYDLALQCDPIEDALLAGILFARGMLYAAVDKHEQAIDDFNRAHDTCIDPCEQASIRHRRGCSYVALKRYEDAIADFTEAAIACANDQEAILILEDRGKAQIMMGWLEDAMKDYQLILEYGLDQQQQLHFQTSFFFCQGAIFTKNHEYEKAIESYTKMLECDSHPLEARAHILYLRSHAYGRLKKFDLCEIDISEAIKCGSDKVQFFGARAVARVGLKKYPEAIADITAAINSNSASEEWKAELLYIRGVAHRENNHPDMARQDWEAALKCTFTKEGLRENIEAALNPKTEQPVDIIDTIWGSVAFELPDSLQK